MNKLLNTDCMGGTWCGILMVFVTKAYKKGENHMIFSLFLRVVLLGLEPRTL